MDLNHLYHRHQIALHMAGKAGSEPGRAAHLALAEGYAAQIRAARNPAPAADRPDPGLVVAIRTVEIVA
ncbi:hypothetical protein G7078_07815 [Sphingomonas sinipercae]|uniref:Uncharacterized protein n=1 Tax=Sphingomonas sinipercae TaxID=2714944 RepID=A0A6G7ZK66_9SPHN|nr:hypothetical protein [Sphingomonas sinipercae]QIL01332.1 hypothetical protein G7078_07815 [Sphingomonas sinipercae]